MYTVFTFALIGVFIGVGFWHKYGKNDHAKRTVLRLLVGIGVGGGLNALVGLVVAAILTAQLPRRDVIYGPANLVAMRSTDGLSGTFVWGAGSIGGSVRYNFMMVSDDGSMVPGSVSADSLAHITEDKAMVGRGTWTTIKSEPDYSVPLSKWALKGNEYAKIVRHDFRVPVGTVVQQFNVK